MSKGQAIYLFYFILFFCTETSGLFASFDRSAWILKPHRILISDYRTDYRVFGNTIYCSFLGEGVHNARLSVLLWLFCHASSLCNAFEQASCAPPARVSLPPQFRHTFCKLALYIATAQEANRFNSFLRILEMQFRRKKKDKNKQKSHKSLFESLSKNTWN